MGSDFRISVDFGDHPKLVKLEKNLGNNGVASWFHLLAWTRKYRAKGVLTGLDADDVENGARWPGECGA